MATLKEFEDALRQNGMVNALAILEALKKRDREKRSIAPARRVVGRKMTAELARTILDMHATTGMTQQEIAFKLGVNQGRVNEVIKRGKWLNSGPGASEVVSRDQAMQRLAQRARARRRPSAPISAASSPTGQAASARKPLQSEPAEAVPATRPALPLFQPEVAAPPEAGRGRTPLSRPAMENGPAIVSAQLAFLDL